MSKAKHYRAVFDTNIFVAAFLSKHERSPNRELVRRWLEGDFSLVVCGYLLQEIAAKFLARRISPHLLLRLLNDLERYAEWQSVAQEKIAPVIEKDSKDDPIIACAVQAHADYLVTNDRHFEVLNGMFAGVRVVDTLHFLWAVRGDTPTSSAPAIRPTK